MKINPISIAYLPGIVQGCILLVALFLKRGRMNPSNRILAALLISVTLLMVHHGLLLNGHAHSLRHFGGLAASFWFGISPLLYLYIKSLLDSQFQFKKWHWLLFAVPLYNFTQWVLHLLGFRYGMYLLFSDFDTYVYAWIFHYLLSSGAFSIASLVDLRRAELQKRHKSQITWLTWYLYAFLAVLLLSVVLLLFFISADEYTDDFEFSLLIVFEVFVFVLVFKSVYFSNYIGQISNDKYRQNPKQNGQLKAASEDLMRFMEEEKPWLNKDLGLAGLAEGSGIPENTLSQIFSQELKTHFYEFVNGYRLLELEKMITDPSKKQFKIASLAEDCGFSSKTSFYKAFKEKHGMTPTEFLKLQA